ncbi:MAG: heterodisulfide reductase-related iron-sulfur binding cluster [Planctomycetota bacterium]|nr:heterodisulfide reductase-related iron-sulfur binding cluster [Planctomycetota bacterium]
MSTAAPNASPAPLPAPEAPHAARTISGLGDEAPAPGTGGKPRVPLLQLDPRTYDRALGCVHCGLCLPACPTYTENGLEADSPRGRIYLMKGLADGKIELTNSVVEHLDLCLDCRACETACPSGVVYHELIEETRARLAEHRTPTLVDRLVETIFFHIFTYPLRLKLFLLPVRVLQKVGVWEMLTRSPLAKMLPGKLEKMQQMLPPTGPLWEKGLDAAYPAAAGKRATIALFPGCVASVLFQDVNRQTVALLQAAGCEVVVPRSLGCCGAIHHHGGRVHAAEDFAKANIDALFPNGTDKPIADYIVNNIAGCGAMLRDYAHLLRDDPAYAAKAKAFTARVRDISEILVEFKPTPPTREMSRTVTYHDACHLAHAQKVTAPPRQMLSWIPGLKVIPLPEADMCCGAAGTYNLTQPAMARDLAVRKLEAIKRTGATTCVTGNVGCAMQIQSEADRMGMKLKVVHPVTLLHEAYFGAETGKAEKK